MCVVVVVVVDVSTQHTGSYGLRLQVHKVSVRPHLTFRPSSDHTINFVPVKFIQLVVAFAPTA